MKLRGPDLFLIGAVALAAGVALWPRRADAIARVVELRDQLLQGELPAAAAPEVLAPTTGGQGVPALPGYVAPPTWADIVNAPRTWWQAVWS